MSQLSTGLSRDERRRSAAASSKPVLFVHSYKEAAAIAGFGLRTLERLIALGEGPDVVELSPRRRGITDPALRVWIKRRTRKTPLGWASTAEYLEGRTLNAIVAASDYRVETPITDDDAAPTAA